jgi:hypothetical protein
METYRVLIAPSAQWTRVLVNRGPDELLRAYLPCPREVRHERAVVTWLEGLALWLDTRLSVVLSVDVQATAYCLGLTDEMGLGGHSLFHAVEVQERGVRRRRGQRIRGMGDFGELRALGRLHDARLVP